MKSCIGQFIDSIKNLIEIDSPLISVIYDLELFIKSLEELESIIGMEDIKDSIINKVSVIFGQKIKNTIDNTVKTTNFLDGQMLHTIIYGDPGVGKTRIARILANIWTSLHILKDNNGSINEITNEIINQTTDISSKFIKKIKYISFSETSIKDILNKFCNLLLNEIYNNTSYRIKLKILKIFIDDIKHKINIINKKLYKIFIENTENVINIIDVENNNIIKNLYKESNFIEASRIDVIGNHFGETEIKTKKFFEKNIGKVIFFDEAYSILQSDQDSFGKEFLTSLCKIMSDEPEKYIIIFAGYEESIKNNILSSQPGLERRMWKFTIKGDYKQLSKIFIQQLNINNWVVDKNINLDEFFSTNKEYFLGFGGDTLKLTYCCKDIYSKYLVKDLLEEIKLNNKCIRYSNNTPSNSPNHTNIQNRYLVKKNSQEDIPLNESIIQDSVDYSIIPDGILDKSNIINIIYNETKLDPNELEADRLEANELIIPKEKIKEGELLSKALKIKIKEILYNYNRKDKKNIVNYLIKNDSISSDLSDQFASESELYSYEEEEEEDEEEEEEEEEEFNNIDKIFLSKKIIISDKIKNILNNIIKKEIMIEAFELYKKNDDKMKNKREFSFLYS